MVPSPPPNSFPSTESQKDKTSLMNSGSQRVIDPTFKSNHVAGRLLPGLCRPSIVLGKPSQDKNEIELRGSWGPGKVLDFPISLTLAPR